MLGGNYHHRDSQGAPQVLHHRLTVHIGQTQINNERIPLTRVQMFDCLRAGPGNGHAQAANLHRRHDGADQLRIVVDKEERGHLC